MARQTSILIITVVSIVLAVSEDEIKVRNKRAPLKLVAKFAIENFLSFGLESLIEQITNDDSAAKELTTIEDSLTRIDENFKRSILSLEDIKEKFQIEEASRIKREFQVLVNELDKITKAAISLGNSVNITESRHILMEDVANFERDVESVPGLLVKLHFIIIGQSVSSAGRTQGLLCEYVGFVIRKLESETSSGYDVRSTLSDINGYMDSLMRLQVNAFQLRNISCSSHDLVCAQEGLDLEHRLYNQSNRLQECIPLYLHVLAEPGPVENLRILDAAHNKSLFIQQRTSIVINGHVDWDRITNPNPKGLRCSDNDTWTLVKAPEGGYYLKYNDICYLSFDTPFINFVETFPTFWTESDRIDRRDFLICLQNRTTDTVVFMVLPAKSERSTTYWLKEAKTGKFLNIQQKKTSLLVEIVKRLVLVLFLNDNPNSWILRSTAMKEQLPCKDATENTDLGPGVYISKEWEVIQTHDEGMGINPNMCSQYSLTVPPEEIIQTEQSKMATNKNTLQCET